MRRIQRLRPNRRLQKSEFGSCAAAITQRLKTALLGFGALLSCTLPAADLSCLGQIVPGERIVEIAAPAYSIVRELHVQRGSRVEQGDMLAVLREAPLTAAQLEQARQRAAQAEAELAQARAGERPELIAAQRAEVAALRAEAQLLEQRLANYGALVRDNYVEHDRYDEITSELAAMRARIERETHRLDSLGSGRAEDIARAEAAVLLARAEVEQAATALELQSIRAPIAGEVLDILAWPGESVGEGGRLMRLGDTHRMMILAEVDESDLPRMRLDAPAIIRGQALAEEQRGRVVEIGRFLDSSRVFPVQPTAYVDRRVVTVRIRPDRPKALAGLTQAEVVVIIETP